jgi:hypothetical protein
MKKGNLIFIVGGLGLLYYFFTRKKTTMLPNATISPASYPSGLKENDFVKGTFYEEVYLLKNGVKRPVTRNYWLRYYGDNYGNVKVVDQSLLVDIPNGAVLDI